MGVIDGEEDLVKELVTPDIPRVDAVTGPATGQSFLLVKSQEDGDAAAAEVEKQIFGGAAVGAPGDGTLPKPDPEDDGMDGTNEALTRDPARLENADAAAGPTGQTPGSSDAAPDLKGAQNPASVTTNPASAAAAHGGAIIKADEPDATRQQMTVAEALFGLRKALGAAGLGDEVLGLVDDIGGQVDQLVAKASTGMEAGLDADGDKDGDEPTVDAITEADNADAKTPANKSLDVPAVQAVTVEQLSKSLEPVFKSIVEGALKEGLEPLEKRLSLVEEQPQSGGPFLNGAAGTPQSDYYVVSKGSQRPTVASDQPVEALEKALEVTSDPYLRERLQQEIARALHPTHVGS